MEKNSREQVKTVTLRSVKELVGTSTSTIEKDELEKVVDDADEIDNGFVKVDQSTLESTQETTKE